MTELKLRPGYQEEVFGKTVDYFRSKDGAIPAFLDVTVGGGKTALAAFLAKHVASKGGRVLILARQGELIQQDGAFAEAVGLKVSYFSASLGSKNAHHNVVAATEGTISRALDTTFASSAFDLILVDESHQVDHEDEETMMMRTLLHFQALNPKVRILGLTGSPYRGTESIVGDFWGSCLARVSTESLIEEGWLVQPHFGWPEHLEDSFDFSSIEQPANGQDWSDEQLDHFREGDPTKTQRIMVEVVHRTADGLGVLIFSQTRKHAREIADALPPGSWAIVTDETPEGERADILARARSGDLKFTINLALLSTGIDVSYWQYIVYLRPVGSLVLLIQSIGRVLRLHIESGVDMNSISKEDRLNEIAASRKPNAMVFDYAGVMEKLGPLYENPILAQAQFEKAKREGSVIYCPKCSCENSDKARRCIGVSSGGVRCDFYWIKQDCRKCGAHNDVTARDCRVCGEQLLDPNAKLLHKAYTDQELVAVEKWEFDKTKNGGILVRYILEGDKPDHGWPIEFYAPCGSQTAKRVWYNNFVKLHVRCPTWQSKIYVMRSVDAILGMKAAFSKPTHIAYRLNDKSKFVIGRRKFNNGETIDQKGATVND